MCTGCAKEIFYDSFLSNLIVLKRPKPNQINTFGDLKNVFKIKNKIGWYVYYYYLNGSEDYVLSEKCYLKNRKGLTICPPDRDSDEYEVRLLPNDKRIIKFRINADEMGAYSYGLSLKTSYL